MTTALDLHDKSHLPQEETTEKANQRPRLYRVAVKC